MGQLDQDELILGQARGGSVEDMERLARKAERWERGVWNAAVASGLATSCVVAWNFATQGAQPLVVLGGLLVGLLPGVIVGGFAHDAVRSYTSRHVQAPGVGDVIRRWKDPQPDSAAAPGRENELTRLLDEVHKQVAALPEGPQKASSLEALTRDRNLAGQARGGTLEEMRAGCAKAAVWAEYGRRTGLGLGILLGLGAGAMLLAEGVVGVPGTLAITAAAVFIVSTCLSVALSDKGRGLGSRFEERGVEDLLERWTPRAQERRARAAEIVNTATRLREGGARTSVAAEKGGVRIGGVFLRGKREESVAGAP